MVVSAVIEDAVVVGGCGSSWETAGARSVTEPPTLRIHP